MLAIPNSYMERATHIVTHLAESILSQRSHPEGVFTSDMYASEFMVIYGADSYTSQRSADCIIAIHLWNVGHLVWSGIYNNGTVHAA